jgi:CspA family cold shock protein
MYERRPTYFRVEDVPAGRRVEARVKWFDAAKGFGFVAVPDGSPDAFLPMAALRRAGLSEVREGAAVTCEIGSGAKGPFVVAVLSVGERAASPAVQTLLDGAVKWYEPAKGYGFIAPDGGGKDVFVHVTALRRSGVSALSPGQRVRVAVVQGRKGTEAERVTLL